MGPWKVHLIFVFLLYCLLNYWYIAESYTATPETRMNLDRSLNWLGSIYFILWAATPLMAWGLFLWALVTGLKQYALYLPWKNAATVGTPDSSACSPIIFSAVRVALAVSVLFGAARLSLDIFEINFYAGQFHMDTTYYDAAMRFIQVIAVCISVSLFIVYKNLDDLKTDKSIRSIIIAFIIIYVPGYIVYFLGQSLILGAAWWFPIPDGHGWSESQINMANTYALLSKWLPVLFAGIFTSFILKRLKRDMNRQAS